MSDPQGLAGSTVSRADSAAASVDLTTLLSLWLDANDASTITASAGAVSKWDDKSGQGNHVSQATAGSQPTTGTRSINGKNALDFDGGDFLSAFVATVLDGSVTAFVVWQSDIAEGIGALLDHHLSSNNNTRTAMYADTRGGTKRHSAREANGSAGGAAVYVDLSSELASATTYITDLVVDGSAATGRVNGSLVGTATFGSSSDANTLNVGRQAIGPIYLDGLIAEVRVYNTVLTATQQFQVRSELATKWGVTL